MPNLYDSLIAPEWRNLIAPAGFADGVVQSLRAISDKLGGITEVTLRKKVLRPYYRTIEIKTNTIGKTADGYVLDLNITGIDVFGAGLDQKTALVGRDFSPTDTGYLFFHKHPSYYGTTVTKNGEPSIVFLCIGGALSNSLSPLDYPYFGATDETVRSAITEVVDGAAPLGVSENILAASFGCRVSSEKLVDTWVEGTMSIGLTESGDLVYAPTTYGIKFTAGYPLDLSAILDQNSLYTVVNTLDGVRVVYAGYNDAEYFENTLKEFPNISGADGMFYGSYLIQELKKIGCVFWCVPYIKAEVVETALREYRVTPNRVTLSVACEPTEHTELNIGTGLWAETDPTAVFTGTNIAVATSSRAINFS